MTLRHAHSSYCYGMNTIKFKIILKKYYSNITLVEILFRVRLMCICSMKSH
jgi:hypothetical protein